MMGSWQMRLMKGGPCRGGFGRRRKSHEQKEGDVSLWVQTKTR